MSRYIGKRVFYTCDNCGKSFSLNKKSRCEDDKNFCSQNCLDNLKPKIMENKSIEVGQPVRIKKELVIWQYESADILERLGKEGLVEEVSGEREVMVLGKWWYVENIERISKSTDGGGKKEELKTAREILDYNLNLGLLSKTEEQVLRAMEQYANQFKQSAPVGLKETINEQDRMIGELTRKVNQLQDTETKRQEWLSKAKKEAGYDNNESFDNVWKDVLEKSKLFGRG